MNLEHVSAQVQPRGAWEAIDLGLRLARRHYGALLASGLLFSAPFFAALQIIFWNAPGWAIIVYWWLEPLFERTHLHVLARALFGDPPDARSTLRELPGYGLSGLLGWLTIHRLRPTRALDLPVTQLEGLTGSAARARLRLLRRGTASGSAHWHQVVVAHVEIFLLFSLILLLALGVPPTVDFDLFSWLFGFILDDLFPFFFDETVGGGAPAMRVLGWLYFGCVTLAMPFFVGGGFGLYINRRTILEGWDLEIAFRRLADRLEGARRTAPMAKTHPTGAGVALAAWIGACVLAGAPSPGAAQGPDPVEDAAPVAAERLDQPGARAEIERILAGEAFHAKDTRRSPRLADWLVADDEGSWLGDRLRALLDWLFGGESSEQSGELPGWLVGALDVLATGAEAIIIGVVLFVLAALLYRYRAELAQLTGRSGRVRDPDQPRPRLVMGLEVTAESLPDDVPAQVRALLAKGEVREALALLYRASLVGLMECHGARLHDAMTEQDCLVAARDVVRAQSAEYFAGVTRSWLEIAYAHRAPADAVIGPLVDDWTEHFSFGDASAERGSAQEPRDGS